ncbi:hypothetical protein BHYA_0122g00130 [Botrytis hyacinthi]|uniref:Uncharacterized protein n=1 Tax=Botrytis hyacinthi TaxID=278943 RepID=A0A4Z1GM43_9HELO|nr:hypothetical protein BHYA_0122g00130 [Botrytis hyacinthi]
MVSDIEYLHDLLDNWSRTVVPNDPWSHEISFGSSLGFTTAEHEKEEIAMTGRGFGTEQQHRRPRAPYTLLMHHRQMGDRSLKEMGSRSITRYHTSNWKNVLELCLNCSSGKVSPLFTKVTLKTKLHITIKQQQSRRLSFGTTLSMFLNICRTADSSPESHTLKSSSYEGYLKIGNSGDLVNGY